MSDSFKDPFAGRFLDADQPKSQEPRFEALGHSGSGHYVGIEKFPNPGCGVVTYTSDEVMAICPITKQPDFYTVAVQLRNPEYLIESKSLKIFFQQIMVNSFREDTGIFCEALAVFIRDHIAEALEMDQDAVAVQLTQKSRGGITITAMA